MKKNVLMIILSGLMLAGIYARDVKVFVLDNDLEIPLEGVKLNLKSKDNVNAVTDENGNAVISISDNSKSEIIEANLAGYKTESVSVNADSTSVEIKMSIEDVIEGQELVVNRSAPETTEEHSCVSTVITKEKMHSTANMGIIEDCMASVRTLPGVSYSGAWGSEPSVRGGSPRELAVTLDGMYTIFPWHWGGGNSILNPSMIESIKLSNGVFSAKYGKASSGLLEAVTLKPDFENFHLNASVSTMSADVFAQVPFGEKVGGMIFGTHLTYLEPLFAAYKLTGTSMLDMINRSPYIRDGFLKMNFKPSSELDIAVTGFYGSDGMGINNTEETKGLKTNIKMDYDVYQALAGVNVKYLPSDKVQLHVLLSYNLMYEDLTQKTFQSGRIKYTDEFVKKYSAMSGVVPGGSYTLSGIENNYHEKIVSHLIDAKLESEIELNPENHLSVGIEELLSTAETKEATSVWQDIKVGSNYLFKKIDWNSDVKGNWISDTAGFASWGYGNDNSLISTELGVRAEFISLNNSDKGYSINMVPQICPRASVTVTPWRDEGMLKKASITTGTGIFVSTPRETMLISKDCDVEDWKLKPNTALFAVLGGDTELDNGWKFKLETYYKYYLSRMYMYQLSEASTGYSQAVLKAKSNGKGHVFGIDTMIEKTGGKVWDGYLSYSFVYVNFLSPAGIKENQIAETFNDVLDEWFYPDYHRFHTLNLVNNWHFGKGWTFTLKGTIATGTPKKETGALNCYAATMDDGTVVQRYTRSSFYSNTLRNEISCPIDFRLSYQWFTNNEKAKWEFYIAAQDIFVNLYSPKGNKSYNSYTGEMSEVADTVDFNIGLPLPSLGLKVQF